MNYLAHLYLAGDVPESIMGNLMGDFLKGVNVGAHPRAVRAGIRMHQLIDGFTDAHPVVERSKRRMPPPTGATLECSSMSSMIISLQTAGDSIHPRPASTASRNEPTAC